MSHSNKSIVWFNEVGKKDLASVGGKGANLGELTNAQIPVPPGFIVTAQAYYDFLAKSGISGQIVNILSDVDRHDSKQLQKAAEEAQQVVLKSEVPLDLVKDIKAAYIQMGQGLVAVRSSATAEDLPDASFAGQQSTFLNVQGADQVVTAIKACWASLFNARAIFYRTEQNYDHLKVGIAVPVQRMVQSEVSGVMFTLEPVTSDKDKITIEAVYGLGEAIVSGEVTPDLFIIDKKTMKIVNKKISKQEWRLIKNPDSTQSELNIKETIPLSQQTSQKLSDEEVLQLAAMGSNIEKHYNFPQDIEWAKEGGKLYITQARPVTTIKADAGPSHKVDSGSVEVILSGSAASPGIAAGPAKIIADASHINRILKGDILVAEMTTPDFVPAMKRAAAILTDQGGRTSHAAIVSRELGIPCVVGATKATKTLKDGQTITVDGYTGKVYAGDVVPESAKLAAIPKPRSTAKTRTKVYVNLAQPDLAEIVADRNVDGVGLLRAEFIMGQIAEHPRYMISQNRGQEYVEKLYHGVNTIARAFYPRPVVYRASDFKTNEYRNLKGGIDYEPVEENPMLGYRGATRYVQEPDVFRLEIQAIKRVRQQYDNLYVMIPFVRTVENMADCRRILVEEGLVGSKNFKLWMMVEIPSNIFLMDKFINVGIDGISIGSNDLTQLIMGTDRDSQKLATVFDERNEAVLMAIEMAVTTARRKGITCSICGQAPSVYPELTEKLVKWGITSVSVSPDMIDVTREIIAKIEANQ